MFDDMSGLGTSEYSNVSFNILHCVNSDGNIPFNGFKELVALVMAQVIRKPP